MSCSGLAGDSWSRRDCITRRTAIFEASQRSTLLTAIGRKPPSIVRRAVNFDENNLLRRRLGMSPLIAWYVGQ